MGKHAQIEVVDAAIYVKRHIRDRKIDLKINKAKSKPRTTETPKHGEEHKVPAAYALA